MDAGNFAVVSRSFAAAREVGACADDAAPFRGAAPADVSEACLRSLDAHAATERLGALDDFAVYAASGVIDRADADELLRLAEEQWTASAAAGDATNDYRTSETASLRDDASRASKAVDRVAAKAANAMSFFSKRDRVQASSGAERPEGTTSVASNAARQRLERSRARSERAAATGSPGGAAGGSKVRARGPLRGPNVRTLGELKAIGFGAEHAEKVQQLRISSFPTAL